MPSHAKAHYNTTQRDQASSSTYLLNELYQYNEDLILTERNANTSGDHTVSQPIKIPEAESTPTAHKAPRNYSFFVGSPTDDPSIQNSASSYLERGSAAFQLKKPRYR